MINEKKWEQLFGFPTLKPDGEVDQKHCNLAFAIQRVTEEIVLKMAAEAKKLTGSDHLCMAGGVALNCVANGKLIKAGIFKDIFIQPASGDAGGALGAAQVASYMYFDQKREVPKSDHGTNNVYLGPSFSAKEAERSFKKHKAVYREYGAFGDLCTEVAEIGRAHV